MSPYGPLSVEIMWALCVAQVLCPFSRRLRSWQQETLPVHCEFESQDTRREASRRRQPPRLWGGWRETGHPFVQVNALWGVKREDSSPPVPAERQAWLVTSGDLIPWQLTPQLLGSRFPVGTPRPRPEGPPGRGARSQSPKSQPPSPPPVPERGGHEGQTADGGALRTHCWASLAGRRLLPVGLGVPGPVTCRLLLPRAPAPPRPTGKSERGRFPRAQCSWGVSSLNLVFLQIPLVSPGRTCVSFRKGCVRGGGAGCAG